MDKSSLFSAFSLVAVAIYMYIGFYTFMQNTKSVIHKVFLSLCTSYAIWSFAYAFAYLSKDKFVFSFWNKLSAIGWCSFSAIALYLVLLITDNVISKNKFIVVLIFLPAAIFFYMSIFLFGPNLSTSQIISNVFYIGNFVYNFSFLLLSILILLIWGIKSERLRTKKQSRILVLSSLIPFLLNLLTQTIIPLLNIENFPKMGQLYSLIMIIGTFIVITKYKFLKLPEKYIFDEVVNEIMDMIILLDEKGKIIRVSKHTLIMMGFLETDLLNKDISYIVDENSLRKIHIDSMKERSEKYNDINLLKKNGDKIPVNISCIKIFGTNVGDFLGSIFVIQDISLINELQRKNQELQEKAIRDSLTNLYNHQYCVELVKNEVSKSNGNFENLSLFIMMLDIDYFKKVNDNYGHLFGDYVLETIAKLLTKNTGNNGYVGRFGGEEFMIIFPKVTLENVYTIAEKIRDDIQNYKFNQGLKLTVSIGVKQHQRETSVELVKNCDDLLYKAKENGRNRVETSFFNK